MRAFTCSSPFIPMLGVYVVVRTQAWIYQGVLTALSRKLNEFVAPGAPCPERGPRRHGGLRKAQDALPRCRSRMWWKLRVMASIEEQLLKYMLGRSVLW